MLSGYSGIPSFVPELQPSSQKTDFIAESTNTLMKERSLQALKLEIRLQAKNGVDFLFAAGIVWLMIAYIWTLKYTAYDRSILTFIAGAIMLPMAFGFSRILRTDWKVKDNPLQPLGLWLNFAQLIYFPFLIFILLKDPDHFVMAYAIITGAHFFPYAWLYDEIGYAIWAVLISLGSFFISINIAAEMMWTVPLYTSFMMFLLAGWIFTRVVRLKKKTTSAA